MTLQDAFKEVRKLPARNLPKCTVCSVVEDLQKSSPQDAKILSAELSRPPEDPRYLTGRQIAVVLEQNNLGTFPPNRINRCRKVHHNGSK